MVENNLFLDSLSASCETILGSSKAYKCLAGHHTGRTVKLIKVAFFRLNIGQTNYPSIAVRSAFASKFNFKHIGRPGHQLKKSGNLLVSKC